MITTINEFRKINESNSYAQILPDMVTLSNNSRLTQEVAAKLANNLPLEVFVDFKQWLRHARQCNNK